MIKEMDLYAPYDYVPHRKFSESTPAPTAGRSVPVWIESQVRAYGDRRAGAAMAEVERLESEIERLRAALREARLSTAAERERIADLWAGCTTEAEGHGLVDIGASIRAGKLVDAA